jgi:hypothetical protein
MAAKKKRPAKAVAREKPGSRKDFFYSLSKGKAKKKKLALPSKGKPQRAKTKRAPVRKAPVKRVAPTKRPKATRRAKKKTLSLGERIAAGAPIFSAFVSQHQQVLRLERELEEAKAREHDLAERAAIEAERISRDTDIRADQAFTEMLRWLRQDGSPAQQPSLLRHMSEEDAPNVLRSERWLRQLHMIGQGDPYSSLFRQQARLIAEEAGVTLREVYTLWWSP